MQIVHVAAPPAKAIVVDCWRYTTACFEDGFGQLPHFLVLRGADMIALSQGKSEVSEIVAFVGEVYLCRREGDFVFMRQHKRLQSTAICHMERCSHELRNPEAAWSTWPLASSIMLVAVHVCPKLCISVRLPEANEIAGDPVWKR